jgi:hypothetical protein
VQLRVTKRVANKDLLWLSTSCVGHLATIATTNYVEELPRKVAIEKVEHTDGATFFVKVSQGTLLDFR